MQMPRASQDSDRNDRLQTVMGNTQDSNQPVRDGPQGMNLTLSSC